MKEYHKIQTVFLRTPESKFKTLMEGHWALPEFELLKDVQWVWSEKIDGTNIRIMWDGEQVRFGGRTDDAHIPSFLLNVLQEKFTPSLLRAVFKDAKAVCIYGEGYGHKIQKGEHYIANGCDFILFDVLVDGWWLTRSNLEDVSTKMNIAIVPLIGKGTLMEAIDFVKKGFTSTIAQNKAYVAEGLICKPAIELFNRQGTRIVAKIKHRDFIGK
ncbi:RNA ligase family protein [Pseudochryseolinea flava]|uniref:RNA ligase domain-containing protein n=1 Tax=Pseudochryseolinea flava TaxID=2059302 RepID=A0A364Y792_9BACT|nr:RNA ligase family protein [Pseudochryseolinea flava]RAW02847.1 hypothetical protein DQQ10_01695 [Pseudochryseolinea flava]